MNSIYLWVALGISVLYIVNTILKYGWLPSISHSYMVRKRSWLFQLWCWCTAVLLFLGLYEVSLFVLPTSLGLIIVGCTPDLNNSKHNVWHNAGAILSILSGCALVTHLDLVIGLITTGVIAVFAGLAFLRGMRNKIFWIEVLTIGSLLLLLLTKFRNYGKRDV